MDRQGARVRKTAAPVRSSPRAAVARSWDEPEPKRSENLEYTYIEAQKLRVHPYAQRKLNRARVREIVADLNLDALDVIHVVEYEIDGETFYWIIDGQHRVVALIEVGLGEWEVRVCIHRDVTTHKESAALFLKLNRRLEMTPFCKYADEVLAEDPTAAGVARIAEEHRFPVTRHRAAGHLACVSSLKRAYRLDNGSALSQTLTTLVDAWGRDKAYEGRLIEGLALMLSIHGEKIDHKALATKLAKYPGGPLVLVANATGAAAYSSAARTLGTSQRIANHIVDVYNHHARSKRLEYVA